MIIHDRVLPKTHNLYFFGDDHQGTIFRHDAGFKKMVKRLKADPIGYGIHMGDGVEGIEVDDRRFDITTTKEGQTQAMCQYDAMLKDLEPVADKMLVFVFGNHDWSAGRSKAELLRKYFLPQFAQLTGKAPEYYWGTYSCKLRMFDKKNNLMYKVFVAHGSKTINSNAQTAGQRETAMENALKRQLFLLAGDCMLNAIGHTHKLLVKKPDYELYLTDDGKEPKQGYTKAVQTADYIDPSLRWYINSGSFLKLYGKMGLSGYAERAGYNPNQLGYVIAHIVNGEVKDVKPVPV